MENNCCSQQVIDAFSETEKFCIASKLVEAIAINTIKGLLVYNTIMKLEESWKIIYINPPCFV